MNDIKIAQNSGFMKAYNSVRKEWPVGIKPYTRTFKDKRKEQQNARLSKNKVLNEMSGYES